MPGMMDTVLNLGLNDTTVEALSPRRPTGASPTIPTAASSRCTRTSCSASTPTTSRSSSRTSRTPHGYTLDTDLTGDDWAELIAKYKAIVEHERGKPFPQDPTEQLWGAIGAVFASWMNQRAITYRRLHDIPESWGTAVNVQAMVFGNMGDTSATGVAFTRNPSTGEKALYGEFLVNAQGEDVVAGIRTPQDLTEAARIAAGSDKPSLEARDAGGVRGLPAICGTLEKHYRDMQDLEFTIERGKLWMLQTRSGKRTAKAALKIAVDMADEGLIDRDEAVMRIDPAALDQLLHPTIDPDARRDLIAVGPAGLAGRGLGRDRLLAPTRRRRCTARAARSSSCASRPAPRTSTACTPPRAS